MAESDFRIGTEEREQAMSALSAHFSAGRLTLVEFEDRSGLIAGARTRGDLTAIFSDLPQDRVVAAPSAAGAEKPPRTRIPGWEWRAAIVGVMPFVALALFFITDTWLWFLMVPAAGAILYGGSRAHWPAGHDHENKE